MTRRYFTRVMMMFALVFAVSTYAWADHGGGGGDDRNRGGGGDDQNKGDDKNKPDDRNKPEDNNKPEDRNKPEDKNKPEDPNKPENPENRPNQPAQAEVRVRVPLVTTDPGAAIGAEGHAEVRAEGARRRFQVEVEADVREGTVFSVFVDGVLVGTVTIGPFGEGELELDTNRGNTVPTSPQVVEVRNGAGAVILRGTF